MTHKYFNWLSLKVNPQGEPYLYLLKTLYSIPFRVSGLCPTDVRREEDGRQLRKEYSMDTGDGLTVEDEEYPCNVLECLTALASRMDDILGKYSENRADIWFYDMAFNLGLLQYDDSHFDEAAVRHTVETWMDRNYAPNGRGGLFPLERPIKNQRYVALWEQMAAYSNERY